MVQYIRSYLVEARPNLWVMPGNEQTADALSMLNKRPVSYVRDAIYTVFGDLGFDYILLDTQPGKMSSSFLESPLWASDFLIIPIQPDQLSLDGVTMA